MEIEKLIEKITEEVFQKLRNELSSNTCGSSCSKNSGIASMVDHTLLKPDGSADQIRKLCQEAREYSFASVCVNPGYVPLCAELLKGSSVKVCTVIGFPLGATSTKTKVFETKEAIENGAREVDMVINVGAVKSGNWDYVKDDIESVVIASNGRALVKVIIETCLLTEEEKVRVCTICKLVGADFVKTSTGFSTGGATVEDIRLMRQVVGPEMGVKASGGIKDAATAQAMVSAGANRLGTSSGIAIAKGQVGTSAY